MIVLELPRWISHYNMIIYSLLYYSNENHQVFDIVFNSNVKINGAILHVNNKVVFFDYSDDVVFLDDPKKYDFYFKRSLLEKLTDNVYPLNFQVNYSYKSLRLLRQLSYNDLINKNNRTEIFRALDYFNKLTNLSHNAMDIRSFPKNAIENKGKVIFHTRLWNPDNHPDLDEKKRRILQNQFRIEGCRIIKKNFKNVSVGLFPDDLAIQMAPDLLLNKNSTSKKKYFSALKNADIGIADDGLKDTPGWKIGEYLLFGKAVISTPITVTTDNFNEKINYEKLKSRNSYEELPEKIEYLLSENRYLEMGKNNLNWSTDYLHPKNYIKRILSLIEKEV